MSTTDKPKVITSVFPPDPSKTSWPFPQAPAPSTNEGGSATGVSTEPAPAPATQHVTIMDKMMASFREIFRA